MPTMTSLFSMLSRLYPPPDESAIEAFRRNLLTGGFVAAFLALFQPWGMWNWESGEKFLRIAMFGAITTVASMLSFFIKRLWTNKLFAKQDDAWRVRDEILSAMFAIFLIAVGNFLYVVFIELASLNASSFIFAVCITLGVGVFPVTANIRRKYEAYLALNTSQAALVNAHLESQRRPQITRRQMPEPKLSPDAPIAPDNTPATAFTLVAENMKDALTFMLDELLFIKSEDNYSTVYLCDKVKGARRAMIRSSLSRLETQLSSPLVQQYQ